MFVDPKLQFLKEKAVSTTLNTNGSVERQIQVIKERMRAHSANLPFPSFTRRMTIDISKHVVLFLNDFPPNIDLSKTYSAHKIMTGNPLIGIRAVRSTSGTMRRCTSTGT